MNKLVFDNIKERQNFWIITIINCLKSTDSISIREIPGYNIVKNDILILEYK